MAPAKATLSGKDLGNLSAEGGMLDPQAQGVARPRPVGWPRGRAPRRSWAVPTWAYTQGQRPWLAWQSPTRDTAGPWQAEGWGGPGAREMACQAQGEGPRHLHCPALCGAEGLDSRGPAGVTHGRSQGLAQPRPGAQGQPTCPRRNPRGPEQTSAPRPWGARGGQVACALRRGWGDRARARSSHRELQPGGLQRSDPKAERFCPQGDGRQSPQGHPPLCPGDGTATGMDTGTQREAAWSAVLRGTPVAKPRLPHVPGARLCLQTSAPPRAVGLGGPTARRGPAACQSLWPPHPQPPSSAGLGPKHLWCPLAASGPSQVPICSGPSFFILPRGEATPVSCKEVRRRGSGTETSWGPKPRARCLGQPRAAGTLWAEPAVSPKTGPGPETRPTLRLARLYAVSLSQSPADRQPPQGWSPEGGEGQVGVRLLCTEVHLCSGSWGKQDDTGTCSLDARVAPRPGPHVGPCPCPVGINLGSRPQLAPRVLDQRLKNHQHHSNKTQVTAPLLPGAQGQAPSPRPQPPPWSSSRDQPCRPGPLMRHLPTGCRSYHPVMHCVLSVPPAPQGQGGRAQWGLDRGCVQDRAGALSGPGRAVAGILGQLSVQKPGSQAPRAGVGPKGPYPTFAVEGPRSPV